MILKQDKNKQLRTLREILLMLAIFFLPFGYDALFKIIMDMSGSYWAADIIFYLISGCFYLSYVLLSRYLKTKHD